MLPVIAKLRWSHTDSAAEIVSPEKTDHGSNADLLDSVISSKHEKDCDPGAQSGRIKAAPRESDIQIPEALLFDSELICPLSLQMAKD